MTNMAMAVHGPYGPDLTIKWMSLESGNTPVEFWLKRDSPVV
jgi:hypothetical protein